MTSSLVGSEMCIRDSAMEESPYPRPCCQRCPSRYLRCWSGVVRHLLLAPVSYTHLTLPTICSV
eukprot:339280-Prorocentrum_lima.AAC.1